jgi:hypothetical protein
MANSASLRGGEKNVQDWINLVCGVLLFASPWALRFTGDPMAARTAWIGGVIIFAMGLGIRSDPCGDVVVRRARRNRRLVLDLRDLGRS